MNRFISTLTGLAILFACVASAEDARPSPQGQGVWVALGPDLKLLPAGVYRFIFVPIDGSQNVEVTTVDTTGSGPVVPPQPEDLAKRFEAALGNVVDPQKAQTAAALRSAYLEIAKSCEDGKITDPSNVPTAVSTLTSLVTVGKASWNEFSKLLSDELTKAQTCPAAASILRTAATELEKLK